MPQLLTVGQLLRKLCHGRCTVASGPNPCRPGRAPLGRESRDPFRQGERRLDGSRLSLRSAGTTTVVGEPLPTATLGKLRPEIAPIPIFLFDQLDLPRAMPTFQPLLSGNGLAHIVMDFEVHEIMDPILLGETTDNVVAVLVDAADEVIRYANIQRSITTTRKNVDIVGHALKSQLSSRPRPRSGREPGPISPMN